LNRNRLGISIFIRLLMLGLGIIWLVAGVSIASSPKRVPKMVVAEKASKQPITQTEKAEISSPRRNVYITYIDNVYTIQPKAFSIIDHNRVQPGTSLSEQTFSTFRCKHCNSIISKDDHEAYSGLCHGCYIDSKREIRRSGLLGADRASMW